MILSRNDIIGYTARTLIIGYLSAGNSRGDIVMAQMYETSVILAVVDAEIDSTTPQTTADPKFMRIETSTKTGRLDIGPVPNAVQRRQNPLF